MDDNEDRFFYHFMAGSLIILGSLLSVLLFTGLLGLWRSGFGIFVGVIIGVFGFGWLTHKLALYLIKEDCFL